MNTAHILETALLILVAFLVGSVLGHLARRILAARVKTEAATLTPVEVAAGPQLVVAPTIAPIARSTGPSAAQRLAAASAGTTAAQIADVPPAPTAAEILAQPEISLVVTESKPELRPATAPGLATSGKEIAAPGDPEPKQAAEPTGVPDVEPEAPAGPVRADDVPQIDELAHVVDARAKTEAAPITPEVIDTPAEPATVGEAPAAMSEVAVLEDSSVEKPAKTITPAADDEAAAMRAIEGGWTPRAAVDPAQPAPEPEHFDVMPEPPAPPEVASDKAPRPAGGYDEAAAMRAIEGGWTPSAVVAPQQPAPEPELSPDEIEAAMGAARRAVANAASAAEAALAMAGEASGSNELPVPEGELAFEPAAAAVSRSFLEGRPAPHDGMDFEPERPLVAFGRPQGLPTPRQGGKDNLRRVKGITPDLEIALNQLGVYHFDQMADWDRKAIVWLDQHLSLRGRIGREKWVEQARTLASGRPQPARPVRN